MSHDLLLFLKALADSTRLSIIGLLVTRPRSVDELAAILGLGEPTVSHHLSRLHEARLVSAQAQQYYNIYTLHTDVLEHYARQLSLPGTFADWAVTRASADPDAYVRRVLSKWVQGGRLQALPSQSRHRLIVLEWLRDHFELNTRYSPAQVGAQLARRCAGETETIARALLETRLLVQFPGGTWLVRADSPALRGHHPMPAEQLPIAADPAGAPATGADERLVWPADEAGRALVLMALATSFQRERHYTQLEVEDIIRHRTTGDPHAIRVELLRAGLLRHRERAGQTIYRRTGRHI